MRLCNDKMSENELKYYIEMSSCVSPDNIAIGTLDNEYQLP